MAGRSSGAVITRYPGIQVQTSSLGVQVPVGWGTFRCRTNLVWYNDFKSKAQKAAASKGGVTTGYTYSASIIVAICEGPIDSVTTVYVDANTYTNGPSAADPGGKGTALSQAKLNMATGEIGQPVWSYLTSNYPSQAIGYSGLAIAYQSSFALDSGASTPNFSFEVVRTAGFGAGLTAPDADPSVVLADFFQNTRTGVPSWPASGLLDPVSLAQYQDYCLASGLLLSPVIDAQRSASDFLTEFLRATNSTCVWSEGLLKFIPYGDTPLSGNGKTYTPQITPIYALDDDDFLVQAQADPPITVDIEDQSDAYNVIQLEYLDRTNQYNMAIALASDAANVAQYGMRRKDPDTVHCICTPAVAAISAQLYLQRTLYIRAQYKFTLGWMFALLEPGDVVEISDPGLGLDAYPVRIIQIDEDEKYRFALTAEDLLAGVSHAPLYTMQNAVGQAAGTNVDPGGVEANLLLWSEDLTNAAWTRNGVTINANVANDQFGLATADAIVPVSGVTGVHQVFQNTSVFGGENYTYSACLQQNAHKIALVEVSDGTNAYWMQVDLSAGLVEASGVAGGAILVGASMTATLATGVWQCVICGQLPASTSASCVVWAYSDTGAQSWTGDGSNAINVSQQAFRQGIVAGVYAATTAVAAGPILFNPPSVLAPKSSVWAAVAGGPNWGGCNVWTSIDGTNYEQVGSIDAAARYGAATTSFPSASDPDTADSLGVDLGPSAGTLSPASQAVADNGGTLCLLDGELICFETATLTNPSRYTLGAYIRRGYLNTPIAAHSAGAPFVRLDDAIFDFPYFATNAGQTVYVKFQSFNIWGRAAQTLDHCVAYSVVPYAAAAAGAGSAAWSAIGTTLANGGVAIPALQVTGASDNPSASGVIFYYRIHGTSVWTSAGVHPNSTTSFNITSVASGSAYDVGVAYLVNGVVGAITTIASNVAAGAFTVPGSSGAAPGTVLFDSQTSGSWSYTCQAGAYAHVDIRVQGADGGSKWSFAGGTPEILFYGGEGGTAVYAGIAATPGSTTFGGLIGAVGADGGYGHGGTATDGAASTLTSPSVTANGGTHAAAGNGAGGAASGGTTNTTGATGGAIGANGRVTITARA